MRAEIASTILVCALLLTPAATATVIYVDPDSPNDGPGYNWPHAFHFLQDALAVASNGDQIRVAQGTYHPDESTANPTGTGDQTATFHLISGVALYGGYAGYGQPDPDAHDIELYQTILSGDLAENDGPDFTNYDENSFNVITGSGTDAATILHGFTVTAGNASYPGTYWGGGMYCDDGEPTIRECLFTANIATLGGALHADSPSGGSLVDRCRFERNRGGWGAGAIECRSETLTFTDCFFASNSIIGDQGGGAIRCTYGYLSLIGCAFIDNTAPNPSLLSRGGAIAAANGFVDIVDCRFLNNSTAGVGGGAIFLASVDIATIANCAFSGNTATRSGGAVCSDNSAVTLTLCTFASNAAPNGNGLACPAGSPPGPSIVDIQNCIMADGGQEIWTDDGSTITAEYSNIEGGYPGVGNIDADPRFTNPLGIDGIAGTEDDKLRLRWDSPCIDAGDNSAVPPDVTTDLDGRPRFIDDPDTPDTGLGTPPIVDMGAYEFPGRAGDFDGDGDVDLNDFATFALCYMGAEVPPAPGCEPCDLDTDNDVDLADFATFAVNFTG